MPGIQDKTVEDGCNVFYVYLVFIFEGFAERNGIPKKITNFNGGIAGIYFWLGTCLKIEWRPYG